MTLGAIILKIEGVAAGAAGEELVLRIPRAYKETIWHRIVAVDETTSQDLIQLCLRVHASDYLLRGGAQGAAGRSVHCDTVIGAPDDAEFVAKFTTTSAGDVLGLYAYGHEYNPWPGD